MLIPSSPYSSSPSKRAATQLAFTHRLPPREAPLPSHNMYSWHVLNDWLKCCKN